MDTLNEDGRSEYDSAGVLACICYLLSDPSIASPTNSEAGRLFEENHKLYSDLARGI